MIEGFVDESSILGNIHWEEIRDRVVNTGADRKSASASCDFLPKDESSWIFIPKEVVKTLVLSSPKNFSRIKSIDFEGEKSRSFDILYSEIQLGTEKHRSQNVASNQSIPASLGQGTNENVRSNFNHSFPIFQKNLFIPSS